MEVKRQGLGSGQEQSGPHITSKNREVDLTCSSEGHSRTTVNVIADDNYCKLTFVSVNGSVCVYII